MPSDSHVWAWVVAGDGPRLLHGGSLLIFLFMGAEEVTFWCLTLPVIQESGKQNWERSQFMTRPAPPLESGHLLTSEDRFSCHTSQNSLWTANLQHEAILPWLFLSWFRILECSQPSGNYSFPFHFQRSLDPTSRQTSHIKWPIGWETWDGALNLHNLIVGLSSDRWQLDPLSLMGRCRAKARHLTRLCIKAPQLL